MKLGEFQSHIDALGVRPADHLVVHSRLLTFGRIEGGISGVFEALRECVGREGTLALPTFTLQLDEATPYDPRVTPPLAMGSLSTYALGVVGARRTMCPTHSYVIIGARSDVLLNSDPLVPFGEGSCYEAMDNAGFSQLLLGCSFNEGASFVHHVEAIARVAYREWLDLPRLVVQPNGDVQRVSCRYFGRVRRDLENDFSRLEDTICRSGRATRVPVGSRCSSLARLSSIRSVALELLARDPFALLEGRNDFV